jgi:NADPH-dependent 2,4-dienoyl-CoA reductase/sulfur reductase-like enzyme/Ni,Fe-hydrogenase III small subunit
MEKFKYLIVGGGVAGITAAEFIRLNDLEGSIAMISDEPYPFYSRLLLSKPGFFLGKIPFDSIWLKNEAWYQEKKITYLKGRKAVKLDAGAKIITLDDGQQLGYEKLLLALGTESRPWNVPGSDRKGVYYLRDLDEGKQVMEGIKTAKKGITIGGAFVSFEMAELLKLAGLDTTIIIRGPYYWQSLLDEASGKMIEDALVKHEIRMIKNAEVQEVLGGDQVTGVVLKDGAKLDCDMVICGIGTLTYMDWLKEAGLKTNRGILANEYLETNLPDIWVAGDAAEFNDIVVGATVQLGNWANAREHGRVCGLNMVGKHEQFRFVSFYTTQALGLSVTFVGDVRPGPEKSVITRGSPEVNSYGRILIAGGKIIGATLMNRTQELNTISKLIEQGFLVAGHEAELGDSNFDLKTLVVLPSKKEEAPFEKIKVGWFSFSCCEDNTVVMTEVMNDHWQEWKKIFDFRHARVLKTNNIFDEFDVSFIEGAVASPGHEETIKQIREKSKKIVAVGACAITGLPAGQRNNFTDDQKASIDFLITKFGALPKVKTVAEVIKVDVEIPGCPMDPKVFLEKVTALVKELRPNL